MAFPDPHPIEHWPSSAADCEGEEFDWFAADSIGQLGVFTSAGRGFIPSRVFTSVSSYNEFIAVLDCRPLSKAILEFSGTGRFADWKELSEHGLFAYDFQDVHRIGVDRRDGYDLIYRPDTPATVSMLPASVAEYLPRLDTIFGGSDLVPLTLLQALSLTPLQSPESP